MKRVVYHPEALREYAEAAWVSVGCSPYFGELYKRKRALGKKANTAILCIARRMARISWQLLTEERLYENFPSRGNNQRTISSVAPNTDWLVVKP